MKHYNFETLTNSDEGQNVLNLPEAMQLRYYREQAIMDAAEIRYANKHGVLPETEEIVKILLIQR